MNQVTIEKVNSDNNPSKREYSEHQQQFLAAEVESSRINPETIFLKKESAQDWSGTLQIYNRIVSRHLDYKATTLPLQ